MKAICIITIFMLICPLCQCWSDFEVRSECSSEKVIERRVDIKGDVLEVCATDEKSEEKDFNSVSLITPWFGFGHLKTRGLFTEAMNPCGYSPTSEVFFEKTRLTLDRSIGDSGTFGVFVKPLEFMTFFSLGNFEDQYIRGAMVNISINDFSIALLLENSDVQPYSSPSSWYMAKPESEGGAELWTLMLNCIYERDWFLVSLSGGTCWGSYAERGFFNRDYLTFFYNNIFELNFMFAGTTEEYLAPGGTIPASQYKYGADVWVRPWRPLKLSGVWYADYKRPDYKDLYYNDFARHLTLKSTLYAGDFTFTASYDADTIFSNTSETTEKREYLGSIVWDTDMVRLSLSNQWYFEDDRYSRDVFTTGFRLYFEYLQAGFIWKRDIGEEITDTYTTELLLRLDHVRFKFTHKKIGEKPAVINFSGTINY